MMLDADVVACQPGQRLPRAQGRRAAGPAQRPSPPRRAPASCSRLQPHEHWHVDVSYLNIAGTFYYLCSLLDGCSRYIVHWEIRETMTEADVETIIQRAREKFPGETPRIISDNGPQFIAKDFKEFIRICGMTHVQDLALLPAEQRQDRTLAQDPQGRLHPRQVRRCRWRTPAASSADYVEHYNTVRLHSAIGYVTPKDKLEGRDKEIFAERDRKLEAARERRKAETPSRPPGRPGRPTR